MIKLSFTLMMIALLSACAVQEFEGERKANPTAAARARVAIAAEYIQKNQLELAQQHLQRAIEQDPKLPEAYNVMGVLLEKDDNFKESEQNYRKALSLKAEYPQARHNYGVLLHRQKRYKEALAQFEMAANDLSYERRDVSLEYVANIALQMNDIVKAKQHYQRLLKINPSLTTPALVLAQFAYDDKQFDEAERFYQRYLRNIGKESQSAQGLWLGIRLAKLKNDHNAMANYEFFLKKLYPQSPEYQEYIKQFGTGT